MNEFSINLKIALLLSLLTGLLLAGLLWLNQTALTFKPIPGNDRFGLAFISAPDSLAGEARYAGALATGARWDRWPLYWHWVAQGGYAGAHQDGVHDYDGLVTAEVQHSITPLVILMGTPAEEAQLLPVELPPDANPSEGLLKTNPPTVSTATLPPASLTEPVFADGTDEPGPGKAINPANTWAKFVFETVQRYRPGGTLARQKSWPAQFGVTHWEIWNEPDYDLFWSGSVADYHRLLEVAYKSIKTADPQATVLLGGLAFYEKPGWLTELLRLSEGDPSRAYFDAVSLHHYWSIYHSEARLLETQAALESFGLTEKPIWITESGLSVWDDYPATAHEVSPDTPWRGTAAEQAAYVIQHPALAFYNGIERYYHFMLHDDCGDGPSSAYGLRQNLAGMVCNPAQGQPRPAYAAYRLAAAQLDGVVPLWRRQLYEQDQVAFYRPRDKARVVVVWATQGFTTTATISATGSTAQLYWIEETKIKGNSDLQSLSKTSGIQNAPLALPARATVWTPEIEEAFAYQHIATLTPVAGVYTLTLPPATNRNTAQPGDTAYHIGGRPYLLVERDTLPPETSLTLPPTSTPRVVVTWEGRDEGSGVAGYDVWLSVDEGPLKLWLANTRATEASFDGQIGHTYGLAVRARDEAGNEGATPTAPQAITRIVPAPQIDGLVLDPRGNPVAGATVTIAGPHTDETVRADESGAWPALPLAPGKYTFQASAPGYATWPAARQVQIETSRSVTLSLAPPLEAVRYGDFEGDQVWTAWEWAGRINMTNQAFDGQVAARLGESSGEPVTCPDSAQPGQRWEVRQHVTVPDASEPVLSFVYDLTSEATSGTAAWFEVAVVAADGAHALIEPGRVWQSTEWHLMALPLTTWRGQTVELRFQAVRCATPPFRVTLDRVSVGGWGGSD